jgi:hypothetical protein
MDGWIRSSNYIPSLNRMNFKKGENFGKAEHETPKTKVALE